jgi:hypothetical protein
MPETIVTSAAVIMTTGMRRRPSCAITAPAAEPAAPRAGSNRTAVNRTDPTQNMPNTMCSDRSR